MTDVVARFKQHLWGTYGVDPQAVVVTLGANDRVQSYGVDPSRHTARVAPLSLQFEGGWVRQTEFDGTGGAQASGHVPHGMRRS